MDKDKAIRSAKLTAAGVLDKRRAATAVNRAGGQIAPSKYLPDVPRQVHAAGGSVDDLPFVGRNRNGVPEDDAVASPIQKAEYPYMSMVPAKHVYSEPLIQAINKAHANAQEVDVPIDQIRTDVSAIGRERVRNPAGGLPFIEKIGGVHHLRDGNHRVAAAMLRGDKTVRALVADMDDAIKASGRATGGRANYDAGGYVPRGWGQLQQLPAAQLPVQSQRASPVEQLASIADAYGSLKDGKPDPAEDARNSISPTVAAHMDANAAPPSNPAAAPAVNYDGVSGNARAALEALQKGWGGKDFNVISSYRDPEKNKAVNGAKKSQHLHGNAFDVDTTGWTPEQKLALATQAYNSGFRGFGFYNNNLHFDVGDPRAWGPDYHDTSLPDWASPWVEQYLRAGRADGGKVTDSDEFRNWFGNSVTHTDGEPHVFYTGTSKDKDFTSHNVGRHGAWFTRDPDIASEYAEQNDSQGYKWDGGRPVSVNTASRVIPAYVKAENPYTGELPDEYVSNNYKASQSAWFDTLRAKGHDAWMPESHGGNLVVALKEPQQIKSIFNNGKFDPKQKHMNKAEGGAVEQPANGMHMLRMRRAGINTKDDFWGRWRDHMMAKAGPDMRLSAMGSNDSHSQRVDGLINTHRQEADSSGIRGVLQRYGTNENGIISARMPREILQSAGVEPTVDNASSIYHSLPDDESGRLGKAGGGEIDGLGNNNQPGGTQNEAAPAYPATRPQAGEFPGSGGVRGGAGFLQAPNETSLEGLPAKVRIPLTGETITASHDPRIRQVARDYMASAGLPYNPPTKYAKVDPNRAARIGDAYEAMEDNADDPLTKASYAAMIRETMAQYKAAKDAGFKAEFWHPDKQEDPYGASPRLATEDIRNNHHMWVYPTHAGYGSGDPISEEDVRKNPMLQLTGETWNGIPVTVNDVFRAVHDYYGHAKEGLGFRHDGEENAWRAHASMFTPLARMAMTSETRGQNSWLNFGPHGAANRTARTEDTVFAPQKVGILPHWAHHEGAEDFMQPEEIEAMQMVRKNYNPVVKRALEVTRRFTKDGSGATMSLKSKG